MGSPHDGYGFYYFVRQWRWCWLRVGILVIVICFYPGSFTTNAMPPNSKSSTRRVPFSALQSPNRFHLGHDNGYDGHDYSSLPEPSFQQHRRRLFHQATASLATLITLQGAAPPMPARAGGLLQFPIGPKTQPLKNKYHFMRAAPSLLEVQGIYSTNPLFLTNRENAMVVDGDDASYGEQVVLQALETIRTGRTTNDKNYDLSPTVAYHSLAANAMDTADFIARRLHLGREKILPEFTYLDPRGIGLWDAGEESLVKPAIWALDKEEAGREGKGGRPPANEDGTPNETLDDQFTRLRQFLSLQESRTAGEVILVIFPDGTGPALLSCMIAGIPFDDVHALEFAPGEVRLEITPESVLELYARRKDDPAYLAALQDGKEKLARLRSTPRNQYVGLKEQLAEKERLEIDKEYNDYLKQKQQADIEIEKARQKRASAKKERSSWQDPKQHQSGVLTSSINTMTGVGNATTATSNMEAPIPSGGTAAALLGLAGIAMASFGKVNKNDESSVIGHDGSKDNMNNGRDELESKTSATSHEVGLDIERTPFLSPSTTTSSASKQSTAAIRSSSTLFDNDESTVAVSGGSIYRTTTSDILLPNDQIDGDSRTKIKTPIQDAISTSERMIGEHLNQLAAAEQAMKEDLQEAASASRNAAKDFLSPGEEEDWANDWLQALMEIRDEPDDNIASAVEEDELLRVINGELRSRESPLKCDRLSDSNTTTTAALTL